MRRIRRIISENRLIIKNTGYLSALEAMKLVMPFVALPYIMSTIGAENYGTVVFAQTIISYFTIFINFGLDISATKSVAENKNNQQELSRIVSSVVIIKSILLLISFLILLICTLSIPYCKTNYVLFLFAFLTCFSEILYPIWFYQGMEKMHYLTIIKSSSVFFYVIAVYLFLKQESQYELVALLQSLGNLFGGIISFAILIKVEKIRISFPPVSFVKSTFKESVPFFVSRISAVFNDNVAKTVCGLIFPSKSVVAAYDFAQKFYQASVVPIQMMNQAVYPHLAFSKNKKYANKFLYINILCSVFMAIFLYFAAPILTQIFTKGQLPVVTDLSRIFSVLVLICGIDIYLGTPVLVAFGHAKPFNNSVIISSCITMLAYLGLYLHGNVRPEILIVVSIVSEAFILLYRAYFCKKYKLLFG